MKKNILLKVGLLLIATLLIFSCEEKSGVATLRLRLSSSAPRSRTLSPKDQGLTITGYTISGEGPNDSTFSVSTNSSQVDINGLTIGTWNLKIVGMNQQGTAIAQATLTHHLTTRNNTLEVTLTDIVGEGSIDIGFHWNDPGFPLIRLELELRSQGESYEAVEEGLTISSSTASGRYHAILPCGSYDLAFMLYSGDEKIAGGVEALRILDGKTTEGDITIVVNKEAVEPTGLKIYSAVTQPVEGEIEGLANVIPPNTETTVTFNQTSGGGGKDLSVEWYLDGSYRGNENPFHFSTHTGTHRLDALVQTELLGSVGTVSKTFRASVEATNGEPCVVFSASDGERDRKGDALWLSSVKDIKFLRDGRLLIASSKGLQLCEIRRDSLEVVRNFTSSGGSVTYDNYPTMGITDIAVDTFEDIVCTTATAHGIVVFYHYDTTTGDLEKIKAYDADTSRWGSAITNAVIEPLFKNYFVVDRATNRVHIGGYSSQSISQPYSNKLSTYVFPMENPTRIKISPDGGRLAVASPSNNSYHSYMVFYDNPEYLATVIESNTSLESSYGTGPLDVALIGPCSLLFMENGIHTFMLGNTGIAWHHQGKVSSNINSRAFEACFNSAHTKGWALHGGSSPLIATMEIYNGSASYSSTLPIGTFQGTHIACSPAENFLAVAGNSQIMLLRIGDD